VARWLARCSRCRLRQLADAYAHISCSKPQQREHASARSCHDAGFTKSLLLLFYPSLSRRATPLICCCCGAARTQRGPQV
jgi:hypothetical protein